MIGFDRPAPSLVDLEVSAGDCGGCTYSGVTLARADFDDDIATWYCPVCGTQNCTDFPTHDPDMDHDRRGEDW